MCTHAYAVRQSALDVLIDGCAVARAHIDIQIKEAVLRQHKLQCWTFFPGLADQRTQKGEWQGSLG